MLLALSIVAMPVLARAKRRVGERLGGDPLILADAAETRICVLLSTSTLIGLVVFSLTGAAWLDPVAGFLIAIFAVKEASRPGTASLSKATMTTDPTRHSVGELGFAHLLFANF